jgi:hypothetical protein
MSCNNKIAKFNFKNVFEKLNIYEIIGILSFVSLEIIGGNKQISISHNDLIPEIAINCTIFDFYIKWGYYYKKMFFCWKTIHIKIDKVINNKNCIIEEKKKFLFLLGKSYKLSYSLTFRIDLEKIEWNKKFLDETFMKLIKFNEREDYYSNYTIFISFGKINKY